MAMFSSSCGATACLVLHRSHRRQCRRWRPRLRLHWLHPRCLVHFRLRSRPWSRQSDLHQRRHYPPRSSQAFFLLNSLHSIQVDFRASCQVAFHQCFLLYNLRFYRRRYHLLIRLLHQAFSPQEPRRCFRRSRRQSYQFQIQVNHQQGIQPRYQPIYQPGHQRSVPP